MDADALRRWARRGRSSAPEAPAPAPATPVAGYPPPPAGYAYVLHGNVPMLMPLAQPSAQPASGAFYPTAPQPHYAPVLPIRPLGRNARLVRPLTKDGAIVTDPYDSFMAGLPDIDPRTAAAIGMLEDVQALANPEDPDALGLGTGRWAQPTLKGEQTSDGTVPADPFHRSRPALVSRELRPGAAPADPEAK